MSKNVSVNLGLCEFGFSFCVNLSRVNLGMSILGCVNLVLCKSDLCKFGLV